MTLDWPMSSLNVASISSLSTPSHGPPARPHRLVPESRTAAVAGYQVYFFGSMFSGFWRCAPSVVPGLPPTGVAGVLSVQKLSSQSLAGSLEPLRGCAKSSVMVADGTFAAEVAVRLPLALPVPPLIPAMYQRPACSGTRLERSTVIDSFEVELTEWYCAERLSRS